MIDETKLLEARKAIEEGMALVSKGRYHDARTCFSRSIQTQPTAEGYTYLGWMLSFEGYTDAAIDLCKQAIELDPTFGNPYNDIGSYLIKLNQLDDAIPWLRKAIQAERYEPRQFPHLNLGRVYLAQGKIEEAKVEFKEVLRYDPSNMSVRALLAWLEKEKA